MRDEFEKLVAAGKLERHHIEPLLQLVQSGYCLHRSWGFGRITTVDTVFSRFTIDFENKPGHTMDLGFAATSLQPIPPTHILARKASDLDGLRELAAKDHVELIKIVLQSYGGRATLEQIQKVLVPDVVTSDWKKWWEGVKRDLKTDGHFLVPTKKSDPIVYQEQIISLDERTRAAFRSAKGLKAKVNAAAEALKNLPDLEQPQVVAAELIETLNADIQTHQRTQPAVALEAIFIREDLREAAHLHRQEGELQPRDIWQQDHVRLETVLQSVPVSKHRRLLQSFKEAFPDNWHEQVLETLNQLPARQCAECAHLLIQEGKLNELKALLSRLITQHSASSELLFWLAKERSDQFADILGPEVFRAMLTAMERDEFNEKRGHRLRDLIVDDQKLIVELTDAADIEVIKDLTRALQLSSTFDDMSKRSLLGRIVKRHPAIQALISGDQTRQETGLVVSWESLERRRQEYNELVQKKIPANSKEIAQALSYGDLRENHEYKAAKEMQRVLMARKAELEEMLVKARGTDFSDATTDAVGIGNVVHLFDQQSNQEETITILGAWDTDAEKHIVSYQSPIAQALMGKKPGEEVEFEMGGARKHYRIVSIEKYYAPPPAAPQQQAPAQVQAAQVVAETAEAPQAPAPAAVPEPPDQETAPPAQAEPGAQAAPAQPVEPVTSPDAPLELQRTAEPPPAGATDATPESPTFPSAGSSQASATAPGPSEPGTQSASAQQVASETGTPDEARREAEAAAPSSAQSLPPASPEETQSGSPPSPPV